MQTTLSKHLLLAALGTVALLSGCGGGGGAPGGGGGGAGIVVRAAGLLT